MGIDAEEKTCACAILASCQNCPAMDPLSSHPKKKKKKRLNLAGEDDRERHVAKIDIVFALMEKSFCNCYWYTMKHTSFG